MRPPLDPPEISTHALRSDDVEIDILSIGCVVQRWEVGGRPVVLGYKDPQAYVENPISMGALVGRVVNRISKAQFTLDGVTYPLVKNASDYSIHGGYGGLGWRNWHMTPVSDTEVRLRYHSPDGDQGFPGALEVETVLTLDGHTLTYDITATVDRPTPVNFAQHQYFNLMGAGEIFDHHLQIESEAYTPNDEQGIPKGPIVPLDGGTYDFREGRTIGAADPGRDGHDGSIVLRSGTGAKIEMTAPNGMRLRMWTDRPAVQLYTSRGLRFIAEAVPGPVHDPFHAVCLEAQDYPDAVNKPGFPSIICTPDTPYRQRTSIEIAQTGT